MEARVDHLIEEGLARRQGQRVIFARDLLATLCAGGSWMRRCPPISADTGLAYQSADRRRTRAGIYRQRVTLAPRAASP